MAPETEPQSAQGTTTLLNWKNERGNPVYPSFGTIREWCETFNVTPRLYCGWYQIPETNRWLWFPHTEVGGSHGWRNWYSNPYVIEEDLGDEQERGNAPLLAQRNREKVEEEIRKQENGEHAYRLVFFNDNRQSGSIGPLKNCFGFLGVFRIDAEKSRQSGKCVYVRVADAVEVPSGIAQDLA